jgi:hypothetical protein
MQSNAKGTRLDFNIKQNHEKNGIVRFFVQDAKGHVLPQLFCGAMSRWALFFCRLTACFYSP